MSRPREVETLSSTPTHNPAACYLVPYWISRSVVKTKTRSPSCTSISVKSPSTFAPVISPTCSQSLSLPCAMRFCRSRFTISTLPQF